jgi:hypothetical protein
MSKMPYTDWKEWTTKRPDWMQQDVAIFERFVERKWQDALSVAAAEPVSWSMGREKFSPNGGTLDRTASTSKGMLKVTGAVNVVEQRAPSRSHSPSWDISFGRKCWARNLIGCDGDHVLLQCDKLLSMELGERKEVLEKSGLCLFCLKHAAELECHGRGGSLQAQMHASRMRWGAHPRPAQINGRGKCWCEPRSGGRERLGKRTRSGGSAQLERWKYERKRRRHWRMGMGRSLRRRPNSPPAAVPRETTPYQERRLRNRGRA